MKAKNNIIELRSATRKVTLEDLSGKVTLKDSGAELRCLALDVSASGLKLIALDDIAQGTDLVLHTRTKPVGLQVVWCEKKQGDVPHFICGVRMTGAQDSLEDLIAASGL